MAIEQLQPDEVQSQR